MSPPVLEHAGVVQRIDAGKAVVAIATGGCSSCGHLGGCGIGKLASGRSATLLTLPASAGMKPGDAVAIALPQAHLTNAALAGYLSPAVAMLAGAGLGAHLGGSDAMAAVGALLGFVVALAAACVAVRHFPALSTDPRLVVPTGQGNRSKPSNTSLEL